MRREKSGGHIFHVYSVAGRMAIVGNMPYHAAGQWGGLSDALAMEVAPFAVKSAHWSRAEYFSRPVVDML